MSSEGWKKIINDMVVESEGGYVARPEDKGGPTKYGITLKVLRDFIGQQSLTDADVKMLTLDKAVEIYLKNYVSDSGIDGLPELLRPLMLDTVVNHGVAAGIKMLQRALGEVEDGKCGPKTLAMANARPYDAYYGVVRARMKKYAGIVNSDPTQIVFIAGWVNRLSKFVKPV